MSIESWGDYLKSIALGNNEHEAAAGTGMNSLCQCRERESADRNLSRVRVREGKFLSLKEVAERYGVSYMTAYNWARTGRLPAFQVGGRGAWRVNLEDLMKVESRRTMY